MDTRLPTDGQTKLVLCGCGRLHMTCGSVTLHFSREEFLAFAHSVTRIAAIVKQPLAALAAAGPDAHTGVCH